MAKFPAYIPIGELHKFGGPKRTKAYELLNSGQLRGIKAPWATLIEGTSLEEYLASLPEFDPLADLRDIL
jgi:hypothetical protein